MQTVHYWSGSLGLVRVDWGRKPNIDKTKSGKMYKQNTKNTKRYDHKSRKQIERDFSVFGTCEKCIWPWLDENVKNHLTCISFYSFSNCPTTCSGREREGDRAIGGMLTEVYKYVCILPFFCSSCACSSKNSQIFSRAAAMRWKMRLKYEKRNAGSRKSRSRSRN